MARKKRTRGHYCWACDQIHANERFSGRGHARHLCRECMKFDRVELAYRQAVRNLANCLDGNGRVRRRCQKTASRFLNHSDLRLRCWARELLWGVPVGGHVVELPEHFDDVDDFADFSNDCELTRSA